MYNAIITRLTNVRPHSNADRLQLATCYGNQVIVGIDHKEGDWGIYFPTDGCLKPTFTDPNDLVRRKDENGNNAGGMFDENRRVRTQKFRGEISDGFWCGIETLTPIFGEIKYHMIDQGVIIGNLVLKDGDEFSEINGVVLCEKYVTQKTKTAGSSNNNKGPRKITSKMFKEHFDTAQLGRNIHKIPVDSLVILTEKEHGTSGRYGHVLIDRKLSWFEKLLKKCGIKIQEKEWVYLNGTRRVVINPNRPLFHSYDFREETVRPLKNNLRKGETVYFEVVGWESPGKPIMGIADNTKTKDKEFVKQYGPTTTFSYGCPPDTFQIKVYRITMTNEDGTSYDLLWDDIIRRCSEIGVEHVREIDRFIISNKFGGDTLEDIQKNFFEYINTLSDGPSTIDPSHIREGICTRIENNLFNLAVYKHKGFYFKVLEGIIKDTGAVDMEESA